MEVCENSITMILLVLAAIIMGGILGALIGRLLIKTCLFISDLVWEIKTKRGGY